MSAKRPRHRRERNICRKAVAKAVRLMSYFRQRFVQCQTNSAKGQGCGRHFKNRNACRQTVQSASNLCREVCPMIDHFNDKTKAAVTVAEMARMLNLSRQRLHQLIGTAFPYPVYDIKTRRPFFTEELQRVCLEVRRRNCGVDGKAILFYARRGGDSVTDQASQEGQSKRGARRHPGCREVPRPGECNRRSGGSGHQSLVPPRSRSRWIRQRSFEGYSFIFSVRIVPIMSGDK